MTEGFIQVSAKRLRSILRDLNNGRTNNAVRSVEIVLSQQASPIEAPQYARLLQENDRLRATLERVRLAGREIVLKSMHGKTIINDGGIMQDDAQKIAEALRGRAMDEDTEGQHTLYAEVGFLTEEEAW